MDMTTWGGLFFQILCVDLYDLATGQKNDTIWYHNMVIVYTVIYIYIYIVIKENNIASASYGSYGMDTWHYHLYIYIYIYTRIYIYIQYSYRHKSYICYVYNILYIHIQLDTYHDDIYITISWHVEMAFARIAIARIRKDFPSFKGRFSFENS